MLQIGANCSIEGMMAANHRITVNLNADDYLALSELSERYHVSLAWLARRAIADILEQYRREGDQIKLPFVNDLARTRE
jgi:predicted transcriptional regulator